MVQEESVPIGNNKESINKYENHDVEPDISILIAIAEYFNTTIDYLVGKNDNRNLLESNFSEHEKNLITKYRKLNDTEKVCVDTLIETYCKGKRVID